MEMEIVEESGGWVLMPRSGELCGFPSAIAESVYLTFAKMEDESIIGTVQAVWGAVLHDDVTTHPAILRGLGISGRMSNIVGKCLKRSESDGWTRRPKRGETLILRSNGRVFESSALSLIKL
jgi:hypothetical protein